MEDYLNEKYKNASDKYGSETCSVAEPSLCGGFKTGLKVSFDDWLTELDQGNTWSEFSEQRGEFQKAYEALQAEEKKKQRKAPPATQNQKVAYTSPWQAVINWARGAAGSSTSPGASVTPPTAGYTPPSSSPSRPSLPPPGQLPPSTRPSLPPFGGSGPSKLRPEGTDEEEETKPTSPPSTGPVGGGGASGGGASGGGTTVGGSSGSFGGVSVGGGMRRAEDLTVDNLKAIGGSMLLGVGLLVGGSVVANEVYKRVKK
jgi:hypothetical protein